jgi:hypothetical protein
MKRNYGSILFCTVTSFWLCTASLCSAQMVVPPPSQIQKGFSLYPSGGIEAAFGAWRQGGPADADRGFSIQMQALKRIASNLGNYKNFEVVDSKSIGSKSRIFYISVHFERGAIFSSFLVYNTTGSDWIVQRVLFHTAPENIMPWLAMKQSGPDAE